MTVNTPGNYPMEQADRITAHPVSERTFTEQRVLAEAPEKEGAHAIEKCRGNKIKGASNEGRFRSTG
jgi:hypothetical protein